MGGVVAQWVGPQSCSPLGLGFESPLGSEDTVTQSTGDVIGYEGGSVTLSCTYKTTSSVPDLFWYIQRPHESPKYILKWDTYEAHSTEPEFKLRFKSTLRKANSSLTIEALTMSDTAIYYFTEKLYKNSFAQNFLSATMKCSFLPTV
uniref:Ig-like domain-containing protein n=1 Tax=Scleropages formosus TaxID=113540 RepID=A0A8C9SVW2_SCLFO